MIGIELEDVADLGPAELVVELVHDETRPNLVGVVLSAEAIDGLAFVGRGDVHGDVVGLDGRAADFFAPGELVA